MGDVFFDLAARIEDNFAEIDSDIMLDLRDTSEEYSKLQQKLSDMKMQYPFIDKILEGEGEILLKKEEHTALLEYLHLYRKLDDMERLHIYLRGHTDAFSYLKKNKVL